MVLLCTWKIRYVEYIICYGCAVLSVLLAVCLSACSYHMSQNRHIFYAPLVDGEVNESLGLLDL